MIDEDDEPTKAEVHQVILFIVDHDRLGAAGVISALENTKYPNRCMRPTVIETQTIEVEWTDRHPLNITASCRNVAKELFRDPK